jgi:hypothetical protein
MKTSIFFILIFSFNNAFSSEQRIPDLYFSYSWLYDSVVCEQTPPKAEWKAELNQKMAHLDDVWTKRGPELFQVLIDQTGVGFSRKEMDATLSLCPGKASYSSPLVLNVTRFLDSFMSPRPSFNDDEFADLVFHELTHSWVVENLKNSELRFKYKDELPVVKNHLHLMAIQNFVYVKLGRHDLVEMVDKHYKRIGGAYARSWEIVQLEGFKAFINELPIKQ